MEKYSSFPFLSIKPPKLRPGSPRCCMNQICFTIVTYSPWRFNLWSHTHTNTMFAYTPKCPQPLQTVWQHTARHTHPSLQTAVTALRAQLSKLRDFQHHNSWMAWEGQSKTRRGGEMWWMSNWRFSGASDICRLDSYYRPCLFIPHPLLLIYVTHFIHFLVFSNALSFLPSFQPSFCPRHGPLGRPPSTSRLACESTCPRGVITLKSSKSGHVKLRYFGSPPKSPKGSTENLLEARFARQNTLD